LASEFKLNVCFVSGEEDWSEAEDPSFNEPAKKPILLKIKKEKDDPDSRSGIFLLILIF
jgi:hypothetical protein